MLKSHTFLGNILSVVLWSVVAVIGNFLSMWGGMPTLFYVISVYIPVVLVLFGIFFLLTGSKQRSSNSNYFLVTKWYPLFLVIVYLILIF